MGGLLNRPLAGTLMGALALSTSLATGKIPDANYYETDPRVSYAPANKAILGGAPGNVADPFTNDGGPGCYIMRIPDKVQGMRLRAWGASAKTHNNANDSLLPASGGLIQADFRVVPGELLFVIIGVEGGTTANSTSYPAATVWDNIDALGGPGMFSRTDNLNMGGGYTGVFRLNEDIVRDFNITAPANDATFGRYLYRDRVAALIALATPLLIGGGGGGSRQGAYAGGRAGFPNGENKNNDTFSGGGGTQSAGGVGGVGGTNPGRPGAKFKGGSSPITSAAGAGGGGWFGGGAGCYHSGGPSYGAGGGGASYVDPKLGFNPTAPTYGYPEETDAPPITGSGNTYRRQGRLIALWDTPA